MKYKPLPRLSLVSLSCCCLAILQVHGFTSSRLQLISYKNEPSSKAAPFGEMVVRTPTARSMGIRSYLSKRVGKKRDKDDNADDEMEYPSSLEAFDQQEEDEEDIQAAMEAIQKDLEAAADLYKQKETNETTKTIPNTLANIFGTDDMNAKSNKQNKKGKQQDKKDSFPSSSPSSASTYGESVQDRIKRVKAGSMTEEEKNAFLTTALARTTPGSNNSGPPIRQAIPDAIENFDEKKKMGRGTVKGLINTDPLWNAVMGNTQKDTRTKKADGSGYTKGERMNDDAKKKYLDMVTNPDRFSSYAAMGGSRKSTASADSVKATSNKEESVSEEEEEPSEENAEGGGGESFDAYTLGISSSLETPKMKKKTTLAGRLEVAAQLQEKKDKELKAQKELEKQAEKDRLADIMRAQAEVARRNEEELFRRRKEEQERLDRIEQEKKDVEEKKMADLLAAQDAYWQKKMMEDQERKETTMSKEEREAELARGRQVALKRAELERKKEMEREQLQQLRDEEEARENPHESEILEEVSTYSYYDSFRYQNFRQYLMIYDAGISKTWTSLRPQRINCTKENGMPIL